MTVAEDYLTIGSLLKEGIRSTFSDRRGLLRYGTFTTLLLMATWYVSHDAMTVGCEVVLCGLAFCWQRRYFAGPERDSWIPWRSGDGYRQTRGLVLVYVLRAVVFFGAIVIASGAVAIAVDHGFLDALPVGAFTILGHLAFCVFFLATARFLLVFPAYASGERMRWLQSWRLCRGHGLQLGVAVLVVAWLPAATLLAAFMNLPPSAFVFLANTPGVEFVLTLLSVVLRVLGLYVALNMTAYLYKLLIEPVDLSDFD